MDGENSDLRPFQREAVSFLAPRAAALYAADPGLGKSAVALRAAMAAGLRRVMILTPAVGRVSWPIEIQRWGDPAATVRVWSQALAQTTRPGQVPVGPCYEIVSWSAINAAAVHLAAACRQHGRYDVLVVDEAHYGKEPNADRTRLLYGPMLGPGRRVPKRVASRGVVPLARMADRAWLLTGTPAPNHYAEIWTHLRALAPERIPDPASGSGAAYSFAAFRAHVCDLKSDEYGERVVGNRRDAVPYLRRVLDGFMLRHRKADVAADLPPLVWNPVPLPAPDGQWTRTAEADEAWRRIALMSDEDDARMLATAAQSLPIASARRLLGAEKATRAAEYVRDLLDGGVRKVVVFAVHREALQTVAAALRSYGVVGITGESTGAQRERAVAQFQDTAPGTPRVFVGQVQAAGVAITLTAASDVVFVEQAWTPADNAQAAQRAHRLGQKSPVVVHVLHAAGSLDERVNAVLARKRAELSRVFG